MKDTTLLCIKYRLRSVKVYSFQGKIINMIYAGEKKKN